jgi:flagellar basal-body rod protein FlgB
MAIDLNGPVSNLLVAALDASVMRHDAIASNIANINTPGYKPLQVSFEDQLGRLISKDMLANDDALRANLEIVKPLIYEAPGTAGAGDLDAQMLNLTKNTLHYHTLLKGLQDYGSITKMAIKEGKS